MATFEEKMKQSTKKLVNLVAQEMTPAQIALREACDVYIVQACDRIRRDMEREKAAGNVHYDVPNAATGEKVNPYHLVHWDVELDINFKKKEKYHEIDLENNILRFGFAIPAFYVLEEMEKELAKDRIYPVVKRDKKAGLFRKVVGTETVKVRLHRAEICNGLEAASRDYSAGFTTPHLDFVTGSDFAYFLTEDNQERK